MRDDITIPRKSDSEASEDLQPLRATDIAWTAEPNVSLENADLLALEDDDLLTYTCSLRQDMRALRALLSESLTALRRQQVQADRFQRRIAELLGALRLARAEVATLRRHLQQLEDRAA